MKARSMLKDRSGVNFVLEYILTFMIASVLFSIMLAMSTGLFINGPTSTVSKVQYTDIGNGMKAKVIDTYLVAPTWPNYGDIATKFDIPDTVAGNYYLVDLDKSANGWDREIVVKSASTDTAIHITLNGVNSTIPISENNTISSSNPSHTITYHTYWGSG